MNNTLWGRKVNEWKYVCYWNRSVTNFNNISIFFAQYLCSAELPGLWPGLLGPAVISNELVKEIMSNVEANVFSKK